jgi:hypothetical protein
MLLRPLLSHAITEGRSADDDALTQQRVLRRLLTNPGDYIWQLGYGAGLGQFVGQPGAPALISGVTRTQMALETSVAATPAPSITAIAGDDGTVALSVTYADAVSGQASLLSFAV